MKGAHGRFEVGIVAGCYIYLVEVRFHSISCVLVHCPSVHHYDRLLEKEVCVNYGKESYTVCTGKWLSTYEDTVRAQNPPIRLSYFLSPPPITMNLLFILLHPRVAILVFVFYELSKVSAYPKPQAVPKPDSSQFPFALVTGSPSTQPGPTATVELALDTLSTRYSTLSLTSESSTLIPPTFPSLSFPLFSSFPSGDAVPPSLNPTISIIPTLDLPDSLLGPNPTPPSIATTPLVPQLSEQAPFSPPPERQTVSLSTETPHPSSDPLILSPDNPTTPTNNGLVIGIAFASMFMFTIVCLLILRCSRWYHTKCTTLSSSSLTQSGSLSNSGAMEKRKRMRGTLFDVETGVVENLAGIGRAVCECVSVRGTRCTLTETSGTSYGTQGTGM